MVPVWYGGGGGHGRREARSAEEWKATQTTSTEKEGRSERCCRAVIDVGRQGAISWNQTGIELIGLLSPSHLALPQDLTETCLAEMDKSKRWIVLAEWSGVVGVCVKGNVWGSDKAAIIRAASQPLQQISIHPY